MARKSQNSSAVWSLAQQQNDVIKRGQLLERGYSGEAIDWRLESGRLHRTPWRGVYAVGRPTLTRDGGARFHRTPFHQTRDRQREHALRKVGILPVRFTHAQIRYARHEVEEGLIAAATFRAAAVST
jgi:hypothetical protein